MPDPLNTYITITMDPARRPDSATSPLPGTWLSSCAFKEGYRWKVGEDKQQILPYNGKVFRLRSASVGPNQGWLYWYYDPNPLGSDSFYSKGMVNSPPAFGQQTYNKAYEKFKDVALGENATWGTTIAEGREALGLIGTRTGQIFRSYKALRKGNFSRFCKELGIEPKRKHKRYTTWHEGSRKSVVREVARKSSGLWLEYWFGWAPLAGEIYQSTVALTAQNTSGKHWGSSGMKLPDETISYHHGGGSAKRVTERGVYVVKTGAIVSYSSPNVALAQQMGLANPLAIAWELVPFSFVVDWFTNIGDCLGALSDLYGVDLYRPYTTEFLRSHVIFETTWNHYNPATWCTYSFTTYQHRRKHGLISPVFVQPRLANFGQSLTRAATAVSLLVQLFAKR